MSDIRDNKLWCKIRTSKFLNIRKGVKISKLSLYPFSDLTPLVEDRVPEGECLLVVGAPPDVAPLARDTDIDAPLSVGQ